MSVYLLTKYISSTCILSLITSQLGIALINTTVLIFVTAVYKSISSGQVGNPVRVAVFDVDQLVFRFV